MSSLISNCGPTNIFAGMSAPVNRIIRNCIIVRSKRTLRLRVPDWLFDLHIGNGTAEFTGPFALLLTTW